MEHLLIILFILFSIFSSLRERRKRRRAETDQSSRQETVDSTRSSKVEAEEESTDWILDPFEVETAGQRAAARPELQEIAPEEEEFAVAEKEQPTLAEQGNQFQAQDAERAKHSVRELVRDRVRQRQPKIAPEANHWRMNVRKARQAIVYAEILGKPLADRRDDF